MPSSRASLSLLVLLLASACAAPEPTLTLLQLGTAEDDQAVGIAVEASASLLVAANTRGRWAPGALGGGADGYLAMLDPAGSERWSQQFGSELDEQLSALGLDADGHAYLSGFTAGALPGSESHGELDSFAASFSSEGAHRWTTQWGSLDNDFAAALVVHDQRLMVAGYDLSNPDSGFQLFLQELDRSGVLGASAHFGSDGHDFANGLAWDPERGAAFLVGGTLGTLAGPGNPGSFDMVVVRQSGQTTDWAQQQGTGDIDGALAAALAPDGGVYVLAVSYSDLETGDSENDGRPSPWLIRYSATGVREWMRRLTAASNAARMTAIAVAADGTLVVGGDTTEAVSGDGAGKRDALLLRLSSGGEQLSATQWGSPEDDLIEALTLTAGGQILVAGTTRGELMPGGHRGGSDVFVARLDRSGRLTW